MFILPRISLEIFLIFDFFFPFRFHVPDGCDMAAAAGLPIAFGTSHLGLIHRAGLQSGEV